MARHGVPTARFQTCDTRSTTRCAVVRSGEFGFPVVLKADGLAAGKGVVIADDRAEARSGRHAAMTERRFGAAGARLVIEECLTGPEVSFFVVSDGVARAADRHRAGSQAHLRRRPRTEHRRDGRVRAEPAGRRRRCSARVMREIVEPVIAGMAAEGHPFRGFLYVGLMLTPTGPKVIEFNVRLGDPEAQVILPLIDEPLLPLLVAAARGRASRRRRAGSRPRRLVGVVLASRGYPESSESGRPITGIDDAERDAGVAVLSRRHRATRRRRS